MASVDDRIVRMEFDNAAFERKMETTLTSLGKLDKALKFEGAQNGLANISAEANKFNLSSVGGAIDSISAKFLALSTVAITALANITGRAIDAGIQLSRSLSLDQIISGFKEYELNMGSIQTILSNTKADATNLEQVNAALDQLNAYSDQTIYNFGQMTRNIGTFTAAGVDLDTSVQSIKGISNLAAISGSSAEQAATAMYQLSQAVSTGTLRLMDWNSVVNAGMGGEVFQRALFETGKALGTISDVPIDQTFEQWTDAGNSFRGSLEEGWLTADVLTTTLQGFTGELDQAQLMALGYTEAQAASFVELGQTGVEAATKIRTFTQLLSTTKETIASGWSASFRLILGNFEQATELFSGLGATISGWANATADARNEMLAVWAFSGGRIILIDALKSAFSSLGEILGAIKNAFRDIFPPMTGERLFELTQRFAAFIEVLKPSPNTVGTVRRVFRGLFAILEIGWTVIKEGVRFIADLVGALGGVAGGPLADIGRRLADFFVELNDALVTGGGIAAFFEKLKGFISAPIPYIIALKDAIVDFFTNMDSDIPGEISDSFGRFGDRFESLRGIFERLGDIWEPFQNALVRVGEILNSVWDAISSFFTDLGGRIADVMGEGDFDAVTDALNVGLLAAIAGLLTRFLRDGFTFNIGGGFLDRISETFEELTGVLTAMQTNIRANALLKIAAAIGILTASVLVLSLIDSAALTKSLTAMSIGFGQLMASFAIITRLSLGPSSAASLTLVAGGMIVLSGAILILSLAAKSLAELDWDELARGLVGVGALLAMIVATVMMLPTNPAGLIGAGVGMIAIGVALNILAGAVKIFATMSWDEMGRGLLGVAVSLGIIAGAMRLMPSGLALQAVGILTISLALNILALAMRQFASFDMAEIGTGFVGIAAGLIGIGTAMRMMPGNMPMIGLGLLMVSVSLIAIAKAMQMFASMSWAEIGRGLAVMAGSLLILGIAVNAMSGALAGAAAIAITAAALLILVEVIKQMAAIPTGDIIKGLLAIGAALLVLGVAAYFLTAVIPTLLALGVSLMLLGAGFALIGAGAFLVAKAFEALANAGAAGAGALVEALKSVGRALPALMQGFAEGLIELGRTLLEAAPMLVDLLVALIVLLLDKIKELIPKILEVVGELIMALLAFIRERAPDFIATGFFLIISFLQGIRDNIDEIVTLVVDIIVLFIDTVSLNMNRIVDSGVNLLLSFIRGIAENIILINTTVADIIIAFITAMGNNVLRIVTAGANMIIALITGIGNNANRVVTAGVDTIIAFISGLSQNALRLANAAATVLTDFLNGLATIIRTRGPEIRAAGWNVADAIIDGIVDGIEDMGSVIGDTLVNIAESAWNGVKDFFGIGSPSKLFMTAGVAIIEGFAIGLSDTGKVEVATEDLVTRTARTFENAVKEITDSMGDVTDFNPVITPVLDLTYIESDAQKIADYIGTSAKLSPEFSYDQARAISVGTTQQDANAISTTPGAGEVKFEQNIYAPSQLSTADIYKQTRNQITMAKEELSIP